MKENNDFLKMLCKLYMAALLVVLPLYTGGQYWDLGTRKYMLFRNVSLLCMGCWLAAVLAGLIWRGIRRMRKAGDLAPVMAGKERFSTVDWAVACYGGCVLLSAIGSGYGKLAWIGYEGWYMGAVSQLLFVGIYFFVSRRYDGAPWLLYLGEATVFLVTLFGLLHRLGIDPLGLMEPWNQGDWEYSHMLSTLGNINWLCGYYSVALAFVTVHYLQAGTRRLMPLLYVAALCSGVLLGVQGSQGGLLVLAVCMTVCVLLGWGQIAVLKRICALLAGICLGMPAMRFLMELRGDKAAIVADGDIFRSVGWALWVAAAAVCGGLAFLLAGRERAALGKGGGRGSGDDREECGEAMGASAAKGGKPPQARQEKQRRIVRIALAGGAIGGIIAAFLILPSRMLDDGFGSGRGFLWRIAAAGFGQADMKDMLLGAGPDCFAESVFRVLGVGTDVWNGEYWEGAVFTNAHNEVLSQLSNVGILGTISYMAIFFAGWSRFRPGPGTGGDRTAQRQERFMGWLGLLTIATYGAHSLISFQQVLNTPLLFLVLGICEQNRRSRKEKRHMSERRRPVPGVVRADGTK